MTITIIEQALAFVGVTLFAALVHKVTRLNLALACVLCGFLAGQLVEIIGFDTGIRANNLQDIVFYVILPVLVFEAAWQIDVRLLKHWLWPVTVLSTAGMLMGSVGTAWLVYWGINHPAGFPWIAAMLTGAILAATDPGPVIAQLRRARAPEDLSTLFEGESMFNDATAVVLFSLVLSMALNPDLMHDNVVPRFAVVFFGGTCLGLLTGLAAGALLRVFSRAENTTVVLLFTAFASFYVAEHVLDVSGIMAVTAAALVVRGLIKGSGKLQHQDTPGKTPADIAAGLSHTWSWSSEMLNNVLFVIMGLVITPGMFESRWLAMLIAIGAVLTARLVAVLLCSQLSRLGRRPVPWMWQWLLVWGGLRGVIALALVLSLPTELDYWYTVQSMVFGVVLFSLLVQASSTPLLIRYSVKERRAATAADSRRSNRSTSSETRVDRA